MLNKISISTSCKIVHSNFYYVEQSEIFDFEDLKPEASLCSAWQILQTNFYPVLERNDVKIL